MPDPTIQDHFHRVLAARLDEEVAERMAKLAGGSATQVMGEPTTTAEKYAAQTTYIQALTRVREICAEIERELLGPKPGEKQEQRNA